MDKSPRFRMHEWLKVYLIFGAASFLLGFAGYLTARPQGIAARFAARWSDLTGRFPITADLKWLQSPALPAFNSRKLPVVLLAVAPETGGLSSGFYTLIKNRLQELNFNVLSIPLSGPGDWDSAIENSPKFYRKFIFIGLRGKFAETPPVSSYDLEMVIEINPYLSPQLFPALAAEMAKQPQSFTWKQADDGAKMSISLDWKDTAGMSYAVQIAEICLKVLEKARNGLSADYEI